MDIVFEKWCEKLLDTGKGNKLVSFKESKLRTAEILLPDFETIFNKIENGNVLSFYQIDDYVQNLKETAGVDVDKLTPAQLIEKVSNRLNKNEILFYKKDVSNYNVLSNIKKIATTSLLEKGINILYIAFGFLNWHEIDEPNVWHAAPLVLIPIALNNESKTLPFEMTQYEEEYNTNPTLVYKLKNEFGLTLPEFRETNEKETIVEYLNRVLEFADTNGWFITKSVQIGLFSFHKLNMYKDLKENETKMLQKPTIKRLLNREISENIKTEEVDIDNYFKSGKELTQHNVVDADSSQMTAIVKAKTGNSLVLQGPPGTGKSQTITNLIAEFLYDGKKILFVSEKLAALNVVFNNLKKAGLSDFCLELHSNKVNKKDVINELYRVLISNKKTIKESASSEIEELKKAKDQLDKYANTMHSVQSGINKTPYQILGIISKLQGTPTFEYVFNNIEQKDENYLKYVLEQLNYFVKFSENIGDDYRKFAWHGYINENLTYQTRTELKKQLTQALKFSEDYLSKLQNISNELNIHMLNNNMVNKYLPFLTFLSSLTYFDTNFFDKEKLTEIIKYLEKLNLDIKNCSSCKEKVLSVFNEDIFEINAKEYYLKFKNEYLSIFRGFSGKYRRDVKAIKQYLNNAKQKLKYEEIVNLLKETKHVQQLENDIIHGKQHILDMLTNKNQNFNWQKLELDLKTINSTMPEEINYLKNIDKIQFKNLQNELKYFVNFYKNSENKLKNIEKLQEFFDVNVINFEQMNYEDIISKINNLLNDFDKIEYWIRFYGVLSNISKQGLKDFIDKFIDSHISIKKLQNTFKLMFYTQWMYYIVNQNCILHNFSALTQDMAVENFKKKDKLKFEISKAEIISKLTKNIPNVNTMAPGSQMSTLVREANKKSKKRPVRLLLRDIGQLVQRLKPCFLMSPLSVSTYLDSETCKFDVVIFDEASQIFPWDAIGSIARGKQVIVVGDSKQMPPSNFFNASLFEEDTEFEEDVDDSLDFESILDLCSTAFDQTRLSWHYRSKTEELISFSNANFYDNSLITFPSAFKDNQDTGIDFYYVQKGIFNRNKKNNVVEAEKVVDLVFEHFKKHPERSLGVVAFSISQQLTIESLIQKRLDKNIDFAEFFDSKRQEPFFVKNLETVQGDERDTIIFSVAYAKDSAGKFIHNFGPLNQKGGERRLNVAITRAKYNVKLVASIRSLDIDLNKSSALGTKLLKGYLDCAEHGVAENNSLIADVNAVGESDFELDVFNELKKAGYKANRHVGCSGYRIDIGVKHPEKSDYVLAIECDGNNYRSFKTTRDRDRIRPEVLERLGWKFYRLWSCEWFLNKEIEKKKLFAEIDRAIELSNSKKIVEVQAMQQSTKQNFVIEQAADNSNLKSLFKEYEVYDINSDKSKSICEIISAIVEKEAPITEELLIKKTVSLFDREKVTSAVRLKFDHYVRKADNVFKVKNYYVKDKNMVIEMRVPKEGDVPRDILMISSDELASGMLEIIKNNVGITKDGLFIAMCNLLGFSKKGSKIIGKLSEVLELLIRLKKVKKIGDELF